MQPESDPHQYSREQQRDRRRLTQRERDADQETPNRWRKAAAWDWRMDAIIVAHDGKVQMIDSSTVQAHQQAAA